MASPATILFVDDDPYVRKVLCSFLQRTGFEVLSAAGGHDALDAARAFSGKIDILVTDMMMPGMTGAELAAELCRIRPGLKVLIISAFSEVSPPEQEGWEFLAKPFAPAVLLERIQQMFPPEASGEEPRDAARDRLRAARAQFAHYAGEYERLAAGIAPDDPDRTAILRQAAEVRRSTLHSYADALRQFAELSQQKRLHA
jgi:DNA-binding NtrC family response regulator